VNGVIAGPLSSGAAIAVVLAVVVMLYLLRPPARRVPVSSSLIWERVLRTSRRPDERLRWWLSLLLAAVIAGLLALSILGSQSAGSGSGSGRVVIVLDNSATMATRTSDGTTRFEQARHRARELISSLAPGQQVLLADTMRMIPLPAFESAQAAAAALDRLSVGHGTQPWIPGPVRAAAAETFQVFTDGVQLRDVPSHARIESVFEPVENIGITRFEIGSAPMEILSYQAFIQIENAGANAKQVELSLRDARGRTRVQRLSVPAFGAAAQTLDVTEFAGGPLRAALTAVGDGLALDDVAYAYLPRRRIVRLTLVTDSNPYLEKSLSAQPRVRLKVLRPGEFAERGEADAYVFDRYAPPTRPSVPALIIRPVPVSWLPALDHEILAPQVARWDASHPLLARLSPRDLRIDRAVPPRIETGQQQVLVRGAAGEALLVASDSIPRWICLAFSLDETNFALHAGFPVFLANAVNWMSSERVIATARLGEVGLPLPSARVIAMDGSQVAVRHAGEASRFAPGAPGIYSASSPGGSAIVVVNALESKLTQVNRSTLSATAPKPQTEAAVAADPWFVLMTTALLLLLFEWAGYHRRLTV
jgi:hypothetical protein